MEIVYLDSINYQMRTVREYLPTRGIQNNHPLRFLTEADKTEADKMMHISQPSVSRLIADLEHSAGFPLFVRVGRGLTPTLEGQHFYEGVEGMFVGIGRLQDLAKSIRTSQGGTTSIGAIQSIATIELPKAISRL